MFKRVSEAAAFINERIPETPEVGIILGTGLGGLAGEILESIIIPYESIPHFPKSTVEGHEGELIAGFLGERYVLAMKGRFHFYEGYPLQDVVFPIRVMKQAGIRMLIISNASGGLNPSFKVGDMMFVEDHINLMNLMNENPLKGPHYPEFGDRFPDMNQPYDEELLQKAEKVATELGIPYRKGVYAGVTGPTFETRAEYKYIRYIGADAVGMSTVPESIAANQMNLPVFAISVIADLGVEGKIVEISHRQVIDAASHVEPAMTRLIKGLLVQIESYLK
jgi:purine-nucleoside phosphorylase